MRFFDLRRLAWIAIPATLISGACASTSEDEGEAIGDVSQELSPLVGAWITGITAAINNAEIAEGQLAAIGAQDPAVVAFAQMMVKDHSKSNQDQALLLSSFGLAPMSSTLSRMLTVITSSQIDALQMLTGSDFDRVYMDYQLQLHQMTLTLLDTQLIPAAQHIAFRDFLIGVRDTVAMHLDLALTVAASLGP
jgi:putative membrane protein